MRAFEDYNPIAVTVYYISALLIPVVSMNPVFLCIALIASLTHYFLRAPKRKQPIHLICLSLLIISTVVNALFVNRGETVLVVINDRPMTLEAVIYGLSCGIMLVSSLYYFATFSQIMTGDKLMYLFAFLSPGVSMILSMAFRFVPHLTKKSSEIRNTQRALGIGNEIEWTGKLRSKTSVFSALVTWSLENGITTAESMECRGYGLRRRTSFKKFSLVRSDIVVIIVCVCCFAICLIAVLSNHVSFEYYPTFVGSEGSESAPVSYFAYAFMAFIPVIIHIEEEIKWKYLLRKI